MTAILRYALRCGVITALLVPGLAIPAAVGQQRVGVNSAVNPEATGFPPSGTPRQLVLGQEVVLNERISTGAGGQTQILFIDGSSMSIGPNAFMVIDQFRYDPNSGAGSLVTSLTRGLFRFIGGKLSKQDNAVTLQTPSATIEIRGGVILVDLTADDRLEVIFAYGKAVTITGLNGVAETITRPGFEVTVPGRGAAPSTPSPAPPGKSAAILSELDGRPGATGGTRAIPTDVMVVNRGIGGEMAGQSQPPPAQPANVDAALQEAQQNLQVATLQGATVTPVSGFFSVPIANLIPTITLPPSGMANYRGNFSGSVLNNGVSYQASGIFSNQYNFGNRVGGFGVDFDTRQFSGMVTGGSGATYQGGLFGFILIAPTTAIRLPLTGSVNGTFFGSGAPATGGTFVIRSTAGPPYSASGSFFGTVRPQ